MTASLYLFSGCSYHLAWHIRDQALLDSRKTKYSCFVVGTLLVRRDVVDLECAQISWVSAFLVFAVTDPFPLEKTEFLQQSLLAFVSDAWSN